MSKRVDPYSSEGYATYLFSYTHNNSWWCFEIMATSPEDAQARVDALRHARYDGEIVATIPVKRESWWRRWLRK
jgi:hypothetical protein